MKNIIWKLYLRSHPKLVFELLNSEEGRAKFWAEQAEEIDNSIHFVFPNGQFYKAKIIKRVAFKEFQLDYFNSLVKFQLELTNNGGTELTLVNENIPENEYLEVYAGWVSVLLNLKAVADFQCDLRNHDQNRTWDQRYVGN